MKAIEARDVFRVYSGPEGEAAALQGLTLTVDPGEVVVVLGPSGSGKSTLLRVLAALEPPSAGNVRVLGTDVARLRGRRKAEFRSGLLGFVEQHYSRSLDPELTARELVALQLGLAGMPGRERLARADELLERVGLGDRRTARPPELSGGEQQRIAVCAALGHRPRLLLADEPTGELDAESASLVYELIGELAREHETTTVVVSHDPSSGSIADRVVRVRDGRVSEEQSRGKGEETLVVGRGGWVRLPEDLREGAGVGERVTARLREGAIVLRPTDRRVAVREQRAEPARPAPGPVVAELRNVEKAFGDRLVLAGLSAEFQAGVLTALTGRSGSGKSTLLRLIAGLDDPTGGEVVLLGTRIADLDRAARAEFRREQIGIVEQDPDLMPFLTARENIELALALRGLPARNARDRAAETLAAVGLTHRSEHRVARLSAGERERVAIARALAPRPSILLADEATARLDQENAVAIAAILAQLANEFETAVVCATHDPLVIEQADAELPLEGDKRSRGVVSSAREEEDPDVGNERPDRLGKHRDARR
jgi:ABC-type lipoprotein export system ATPase subunit